MYMYIKAEAYCTNKYTSLSILLIAGKGLGHCLCVVVVVVRVVLLLWKKSAFTYTGLSGTSGSITVTTKVTYTA